MMNLSSNDYYNLTTTSATSTNYVPLTAYRYPLKEDPLKQVYQGPYADTRKHWCISGQPETHDLEARVDRDEYFCRDCGGSFTGPQLLKAAERQKRTLKNLKPSKKEQTNKGGVKTVLGVPCPNIWLLDQRVDAICAMGRGEV